MEELQQQTSAKMTKALEVTSNDISSVRSGRATPALIENIKITAYEGTQVLKLMEMATITAMDAKTLLISPFDPSVTKDIEKGIMEAKIGLTPVVDGEVIRIVIPPISEERRKEYIRLVWTKIEAGKVMIRQIRQEAMNVIRRGVSEKEITQDDKTFWEKKIQDFTDEYVSTLDGMGKKKEEELLKI